MVPCMRACNVRQHSLFVNAHIVNFIPGTVAILSFIECGTVAFGCRNFLPTSPICGVLVFYSGRYIHLVVFHIQEL